MSSVEEGNSTVTFRYVAALPETAERGQQHECNKCSACMTSCTERHALSIECFNVLNEHLPNCRQCAGVGRQVDSGHLVAANQQNHSFYDYHTTCHTTGGANNSLWCPACSAARMCACMLDECSVRSEKPVPV